MLKSKLIIVLFLVYMNKKHAYHERLCREVLKLDFILTFVQHMLKYIKLFNKMYGHVYEEAAKLTLNNQKQTKKQTQSNVEIK